MEENPKTKMCSRCRRVLPLSDFNKDARSKDGHLYKCRDCVKKEQAGRVSEKTVQLFKLLDDKFTLKEFLEAAELCDYNERGAKMALSIHCRSGKISRIDDTHFRKITDGRGADEIASTEYDNKLETPKVMDKPVAAPKAQKKDNLKSYPSIEILAELYSRGYRWKDMTVTVVTEVPISNVQDYIRNHNQAS